MSSNYKIEKNIPLPKPGIGRNEKYPWRQMKVGDSFYVGADSKRRMSSMRLKAYGAAKRLKMKFTTREERNGLRIWRTA